MLETNSVLSLILTYRYFIIFPLACIEGPILALVVGFMIKLGYFNVIPAFLLMFFGDLVPDVIYYFVGRFSNRGKLSEGRVSRFKFLNEHYSAIKKLWHNHSWKTMALSKIAYGLSTPLLMSAGFVGMPFKRFVSLSSSLSVFQYSIILSLGYFLGQSYSYATKYIEMAGVFFAVVLAIFIFVYLRIQKYAKIEFEKLEKAEEKTNI